MTDRRHARLAALALFALALLAADPHLAFVLLPALLIAAIPVSGAFFGERLIVARRTIARLRRLRPVRRSAPRHTVLISLLERSPRSLRGPPVAA